MKTTPLSRFALIIFCLLSAGQSLFAQTPVITSFTPSSGPVGALVTVTGANLNNPTAFSIGGVSALVISNTGTQLTGFVMPGAATGAISLTTANGTVTSGSNFTLTPALPPSNQQGNKLVGVEGTGHNTRQGWSVSLSADGNTAIVGAPFDSPTGTARVYTRSGGVWTQQGNKLVGTGAVGNASQGTSVALSADGNIAIIGGPSDSNNQGAAWVFTRNGNVWTQQGSKLRGTGGSGPYEDQGSSVSLSADGKTAIIGGSGDNSGQGAVWVFTRSGNVWNQEGNKLVGTGNIGAAGQGRSVSLSADGNTAIVGGPYDNSHQGAAWIYTRSGSTWGQQGNKLVGAGSIGSEVSQGMSVFLNANGNTAIIGGYSDNNLQGAAWVFTRNGTTWTQQGGKLVGSDNLGWAYQGMSVSLSADGNKAIVGGIGDYFFMGAAWVYTRNGSTWNQQGNKLVGIGTTGQAYQGQSISLSADGRTAIVGGYSNNDSEGAAWIFTASTNASLTTLTTTAGAIVPAFSSETTNYSATVTNETSSVTVTPTAADITDTVQVRINAGTYNAISSGSASDVLALNPGINTIDIKVTEQDGITVKIYTITVIRGTPPAPSITSFSPASGPVGTLVTITGTNLDNPTSFSIGGLTALVISNTGAQLRGFVMPGAATGTISLTTAGGTATSGSNFTITPTLYPSAQQGNKLVGTGNTGAAQQGTSVSVSADGNTAIVGGYADNNYQGAVWIYIRNGSTWVQQDSKLVGASTGVAGEGISVGLSADGNTAIVGGWYDDRGHGAAWIFIRSGGAWTQQGNKLVGTGGIGSTNQGRSVSLSADGNTAIIGGPGDTNHDGAAWVFTRSGNTWSQQGSKLLGMNNIDGGGYLGTSVSLSADGNTAIAGGWGDNDFQGAAWIFVRSGDNWAPQGNKLLGAGHNGRAYLGTSVSLSANGNTAIVGGYYDNNLRGAAWVYTRNGSTWTQQGSKLTGDGVLMGWSVSLSADGNMAIVGGNANNDGVQAAWVYTRSGNTWVQQGNRLIGTGIIGGNYYEPSVSLSADGSTAVLGSPNDNSLQGAAWVFVAAPGAPNVITSTASTITSTSATLGGNVTNDGGSPVSERGVVYSTTINPTTAADTKVQIGAGTGVFSQNVIGLNPSTTYHVRAYAINANGTSYGNDLSFTTAAVTLPIVSTAIATEITSTSAMLGGNVSSDGGITVTERGIVYSISPNPTTANTKMQIGNGMDAFSQSITGFTLNTTYHVRAYAINFAGTSYGNEVVFTASALPTIFTTSVSSAASTSAVLGGEVNSNGDSAVTERGVVYDTSPNPTTSNIKVPIGSGTGIFSQNVTGLSLSTNYHVRAYAINSIGTSYGDDMTFTTVPPLPYSEAFRYSTAAGMIYGGTPGASLTAGGIDAEGAGYLRLTNNAANQSGFARNTTAFPSANGLSISFEYYSHSGSGGDGLSFFLYDATASPFQIGATGGSLGYAQTTNSGGLPGVSKGYIGIGLDEFGNFSNPIAGRQGGPGLRAGSVTLRGDGNGSAVVASNYEYLTGIQTGNASAMTAAGGGSPFGLAGMVDGRTGISVARQQGGLTATDNGYRKAKIELTPNGLNTGYIVNVWITEGNAGGAIVHHVITNYSYISTGAIPANLSYGFAGSSGGSNNHHEIRNLNIVVPQGAVLPPVVSDITKSGTENIIIPFTALNFTSKFNNPSGNPLVKIKVVSLPGNGILKLGASSISVNQEINLASLSDITFEPAANYTGNASFQWNGSDGTLYAIVNANVNVTLAPSGTLAFPYHESFKNSTASGMVFGGSQAASLTSGGIDASGAGYLRLTNNAANQLGFARNTRAFPTADGFSINFEYYSYGGTGADGLSFFLYDATANGSFQIGATGGSLGYAQNSTLPGVSKGYLGFGFDEGGNFSSNTAGRQGGPGTRTSSVTIRGDGNGTGAGTPAGSNYEYLTNIQTSNGAAMTAAGGGNVFQIAGGVNGRTSGAGGLSPSIAGYRQASITLLPNGLGTGFIVNVWITEGNSGGPIIHHVVTDYNYLSTGLIPANLSYGFAGANGAATNHHEIRNLDITVPGGTPIPQVFLATNAGITGNNDLLTVWTSPKGTPAIASPVSQLSLADNLTLPNASNILSPNGDGKNDTWVIKNLDKFSNNTVKIYDRNGKLVFAKENYRNDWDGTFRGALLSEDTYYYIIDFGKGISPLKGFISVVR